MFETTEAVFEWLEQRTGDTAYYLVLLNLVWGDKGETLALEVYSELAQVLKTSPEVLKMMLQGAWRPQLIANAVLILQRATEFEDDLVRQLRRGSWIAPQLAVGVALLATMKSLSTLEAHFETLLRSEPTDEWDRKQLMAVFSALKFMESPKAQQFEASTLFKQLTPTKNELNKDNWQNESNLIWLEVAQHQWDFWRKVASR